MNTNPAKYKLSKLEKETIFLFNEQEQTAIVSTYNARLQKALAKIDDPQCKLLKQADDYVEYSIPKKWIKVHTPRPPKVMTEEQRQQAAERMRVMWQKQKERREQNKQAATEETTNE